MAGLNNQQTYQTPDTPLAAYLFVSGYELISFERLDSRVYFIFPESKKLLKSVQKYESGAATINVVAFFQAYRNLLHKVRSI